MCRHIADDRFQNLHETQPAIFRFHGIHAPRLRSQISALPSGDSGSAAFGCCTLFTPGDLKYANRVRMTGTQYSETDHDLSYRWALFDSNLLNDQPWSR